MQSLVSDFQLACRTLRVARSPWVLPVLNPSPTPSMRLFSAVVFGGFAVAVSASAQGPSSPYAFWTIAGRAVQSGAIDGPGLTARFNRPWGIAVSPDGKTVFTANGPSNDVSIVDVESRTVKGRVKVGDRPWGVVFVP